MDKKILVATLYIKEGRPVKNNRDLTPIGELSAYAKLYNDSGIEGMRRKEILRQQRLGN